MIELRVLSLGGGVQSTTVALLAAEGAIDKVDAAIFADTQWEPAQVYRHLNWLEPRLPFPVYRVTRGDIKQNILTRRNTTGGFTDCSKRKFRCPSLWISKTSFTATI